MKLVSAQAKAAIAEQLRRIKDAATRALDELSRPGSVNVEYIGRQMLVIAAAVDVSGRVCERHCVQDATQLRLPL